MPNASEDKQLGSGAVPVFMKLKTISYILQIVRKYYIGQTFQEGAVGDLIRPNGLTQQGTATSNSR